MQTQFISKNFTFLCSMSGIIEELNQEEVVNDVEEVQEDPKNNCMSRPPLGTTIFL